MPKKTDAQWQALDARIARMMGFKHKASPIDGTLLWIADDEEEYLVGPRTNYAWVEWDVWEPHTDVAQALAAKDRIVKQLWRGCRFYMDSVQHHDSRAVFERDGQPHVGYHKLDASAICLAIIAWLDAQALRDGEEKHVIVSA